MADPLSPQKAKWQARRAHPPEFDRLNYFYGQMLGVRDFQIEQQYFREKARLHNRALHGHGVACGLEVEYHKGDGSDVAAPKICLPRVRIEPGLALDDEGNELVVRHRLQVDLARAIEPSALAALKPDAPATLYLTIAYETVGLEPTRPVLAEGCGGSTGCHHGKTREVVCVRVSDRPLPDDERCETCWAPHDRPGEMLARIEIKNASNPEDGVAVFNSVRRPLSVRVATRVEAINWVHGGDYGYTEVDALLTAGLKIRFTRAIHAETVRCGVLDVFLLDGGCSFRGDVKHLRGEVRAEFPVEGRQGICRGLSYTFEAAPPDRQGPCERLSSGGRVLIVLRCPFLLDPCCQPVDGTHVGGWVALLEGGIEPSGGAPPKPPGPCARQRGTYGAWTSGNGLPGVNFESWIFVNVPKGVAQQ